MQESLFDTPHRGEQIQLEDATLLYYPRFYDEAKADELFRVLQLQIPWRQEQTRIAGIPRLQPRLSAGFGDADAEYTYSGLHLLPLPWHPHLLDIKNDIEHAIAGEVKMRGPQHFNSVLLNYYRDERDSMGWHSDDETELGLQPVIASLSLGGSRTFALKHRERKDLRYKIPLAHGSLLIMSGDTQSHWLHAIAKETLACDARINLTFRQIFPSKII
ncbi:alpha-ketoglutarate-dependent dioxygenase AlkB family protein [Undibacterium flavidum]|uniref:Alpha-ketoglutarate-dependent dioxygenase AlkB n=1 Tax=Undibacterium flavidum TaxID=2762297 RepID=A0ABR6Y7X3_9BURK|nr:alpha-ketoglutarate-dependent dioxygenase AlkB [Undibacterium flavidum]MBC3872720.1 alpha-ketoglutarate-dependent dioxygenase AlkB [Undibacterium flavidum]